MLDESEEIAIPALEALQLDQQIPVSQLPTHEIDRQSVISQHMD